MKITDKTSSHPLLNPYASSHGQHYIVQPYGNQEYPDILVFHGSNLVIVEVKFEKANSGLPMWNSDLPSSNGIYIYGSLGRGDITFFRGSDIVSAQEAQQMHAFFDARLKKLEREFNRDLLSSQQYGFSVYVRKAFDQGKQHNDSAVIDFFANPDRKRLEQNVINDVP